MLLMDGRIAHNGWANCNSPLHVRYPNVGKYYMQIASRAWHRFFCVRRRGELQFAHVAIHPYCKFIPYCKIHPHFKFTHVEGLIAISPYACVFWTFTNIHINTQKKTSWAWYEGVCVCRRGELQFAYIPNCPYSQFTHVTNSPTPQFAHIAKFIHVANSSMLQFAHTPIHPHCISHIL